MSPSEKANPIEGKERSAAPHRWQERIIARVALAGGCAAFLVGSSGLLLDTALPTWAVAALVTLGLGIASISLASGVGYYELRCAAATAGVTLAPIVAAGGGVGDVRPWLLSFLASIGAALLIGLRGALVVSLGLFFALPLMEATGGRPLSVQVWVNTVLYLVVSGVAVWWTDYGLYRLRQTLAQRDDLLAFVREETEERIAQLEKQQALERQLRQSQKMEALGTLAGGIAHDFNNLLLVIASGAQSAKVADKDELEEILQEVREAAKRGSGLTQQLLAFGRRRIHERAALTLNDEVSKSLQLIRRLIPSNITLEFTPDPEVCSIEATPVDVDQIIMNLCINARDAMPQGGRVEITTMLHHQQGYLGKEAVLKVRDFGVGMTDEQQERAFEPFYTTKRTGHGTGLGLSVVHSIVLGHKGRMELESELEKGTEFRAFFPHIDQGMTQAVTAPLNPRPNGGERILLVDDDPAVRKGIARVLKRAGYDVVVAADGLEALREYKESPLPIELVVTDAVMPNMGGRDLCEAVTQINPKQPCLICSGYDAGTLDEGFFLEQGREFLAKPFDNEQLLRRIDQLLTLQRMSLRPPPSSGTQSYRGTQTPIG